IPLPGIGLPQFSGGIHSLTIDQATPKATRAWIDWNTFSIAADSRGDVVQADAGYSIINRVVGSNGSVMRSLIEGQITAKGSVLLLNQNGILFDRGSQVNVGSFFASTLAINEIAGKNFLFDGTVALGVNPAFSGSVRLEDGSVPEIVLRGQIATPQGGRVVVVGPRIAQEASGRISAPDGQIVLAAGERVWLTDPSAGDPSLRGFIVEFKARSATNLTEALAGSSVTNAGTLESARGNVTLGGLAINQEGRVSASSSAVFNGSVWLKAREKLDETGPRTGNVVLAPRSFTGTPLETTGPATPPLPRPHTPVRS